MAAQRKCNEDELEAARAARLGSLVAVGCRSGATVVGLAAVRRARPLAYVFLDAGLAAGTVRELLSLRRAGTRVFKVDSLASMTRAFGREDARVVGVRKGTLAQGVERLLNAE